MNMKDLINKAIKEKLSIGSYYALIKSTPLMPEIDPEDPSTALSKRKCLSKGTIIKIKAIEYWKKSILWYFVVAGKDKGWMSSLALLGQELKSLK